MVKAKGKQIREEKKMAEFDMSWTTEYQVVESDCEARDEAEFEDFEV